MKQALLFPESELPKTQTDKQDQSTKWPSTGELLALAHCDLPSPKPEEQLLPPVTVLGMGLLPRVPPPFMQLVKESDVLVAGQLLLEQFAELKAEKIAVRSPVEEVLQRIVMLREQGKSITVLADGDPLFFGLGASLTRLFPPDALRIAPGISSLQEACARLCLPWHNVRCVSLHGRHSFDQLASAIAGAQSLCLLTDTANNPSRIAAFLLDRGIDWFTMHVFERMRHEDELVRSCALAQAASLSFGPACTILLVASAPARLPFLGIPDTALAHEGELFTKEAVRAAALARLRIRPGYLLWDIGAGSGAVALEACALAHRGRVFAIEQNPARILCMEENRRRFGAANMEIVHGCAPECLAKLPDPDAIFVGGGLGKSEATPALLGELCARLKAGGRLLLSCILMGSLERSRAFFAEQGWPIELTSLQATKSSPLGQDLRLAALNPVFLLSTQKRED